MIDVVAYLDRIGYDGPHEPTAESLRALHRAHMFAVAFENLDIMAGVPLSLEEDRLFAKIVLDRRGGFCYELNGCFAGLLRALGFEVTMLSARPLRPSGALAQEFAHLVLLVRLEQRWLVDVGFGDSFVDPLLLDEPGEQVSGGRAYRIRCDGDIWRMDHVVTHDGLAEGFVFTLQRRSLEDFMRQCRAFETLPDSPFRRGHICSLATPSGRITVSDRRLIITEAGNRTERPLATEEEVAAEIRERFGIDLDAIGSIAG